MMDNLYDIKTKKLAWMPDRDSKPVLKDIDTMLCSGNFYGILGPNGAGKSSLVRQLLRLSGKTSGDILYNIDGTYKDVYDINRRQMAGLVSFLPQSTESGVNFTVYDVVSMGREPYRKNFGTLLSSDREKIEEAMEYTNCSHLRDRNIQLLSGGERQRVLIARTIVQDTPWIILDEPVSSLDIKHQYDLMLLLGRLRSEKSKTIVAILHDLNLAYSFCNQIILMKNGEIFAQGGTQEILTEKKLRDVYEMDFEFLESKDDSRKHIAVRYDLCKNQY
jgi:iron complex transport system ATP-binding protein